jgi:hypothetical protein
MLYVEVDLAEEGHPAVASVSRPCGVDQRKGVRQPEAVFLELHSSIAVGLVIKNGLAEGAGIVGRRLELALGRDARAAVVLIDGDFGNGPGGVLLGGQTGQGLPRHQHRVDGVGIRGAVGRHGNGPFRTGRGGVLRRLLVIRGLGVRDKSRDRKGRNQDQAGKTPSVKAHASIDALWRQDVRYFSCSGALSRCLCWEPRGSGRSQAGTGRWASGRSRPRTRS